MLLENVPDNCLFMKFETLSLLSLALGLSLSSCRHEQNGIRYLNGPEDLHGQVLCAQVGSVSDLYFTEAYKDSEIKYVDYATDIPLMVMSGKADAGATSSLVWMTQQNSYPELSHFSIESTRTDVGFALDKRNAELAAQINDFFDRFLDTEEFNEMMDGWCQDPDRHPMPQPDPEDCYAGVITVAVSPDQPPHDMIRNGDIVGIEPELMVRFAMEKHMRVEFMALSFPGIIPALVSGKADVGCSLFSITEERKKTVMFTNPWTQETIDIMVRRERMSHDDDSAAELNAGEDGTLSGLLERVSVSFKRNVLEEKRYEMLLKGTLSTIIISLLSAFLGTLLGVLLSCGSMSRHKPLARISGLYISFMRCMPQVVLLMVMFYVVFGKTDMNAISVSVVSFSLCFGAYVSVIFTSTLKSIDKGQSEAALSMGFTPMKTFFQFVLPQFMPRALPVYRNEFISLVKATSIVGYIGTFDLTRAGDVIRSRTFEAFFPLILVTAVYFLIIWLLTLLLSYAELKSQPVVHKFSNRKRHHD